MIVTRIGGEEVRLEPREWEVWVEDGRIPPEAPVLVPGHGWVPASRLELYQRLRGASSLPAPRRTVGLREVVFPRGGVSATEWILLVNLVVFAVLVVLLRSDYLPAIRETSMGWWREVRADHAYWWWLPTLFLHAGIGHLSRNAVALLVGAGAVEFLMGKRWALMGYLLTGLGGAWLSYAGHDRPPLSIGASGAAFGLIGMTIAFTLRRVRMFTYRQRWKTRRVYAPLFVIATIPSLFNADYFGHLGGFLAGILLGMIVPPHPRVRHLSARDPMREDELPGS